MRNPVTDRPLEPPLDDRTPDLPDVGDEDGADEDGADDDGTDDAHILPPESVPPISAEDLVDGDHPEDHPEGELEERRYPSTIGGAFYLLVLLITVAGLVVASLGDWRVGVRMLGGALVFAAAVRVVLGPRDAGMLAVRHKALDVGLLVALGAALIFLASSIPDQPGL
jgi:cation transport ATPase